MSLSEKQLNDLSARWWKLIEPVLSELTSLDEFSKSQVSSTFWTAMRGRRFEDAFEELVEGYQIFVQDNWDVSLPLHQIEEDAYVGDVVINLGGGRTPVRLRDFTLVAKIAAIYYAKHLEPEFDPWTYFVSLDQLVEKYRV